MMLLSMSAPKETVSVAASPNVRLPLIVALPVTVRLLDPPLHEFLPKAEKDIEEVARSLNLSSKEIKDRI